MLKRRASCLSLDAIRAAKLVFTSPKLERGLQPTCSGFFCPPQDPIVPQRPPAAYLFFWHLDILIRMRVMLLTFLLIIFGILVYFAAQEISTISPVTEPFNTAPTRASECQCLPGYIPSKPTSEYIDLGCYNDNGGDRALKIGLGRPYNKESCAAAAKAAGMRFFGVQDGNECRIGNEGYDKHGKAGGDCPLGGGPIKQRTWKIVAPEDSGTYFCQSLSDSQKTKACY